ncbi:tyrosine-type recombinase/integrase [Beijerinckia sp. L45]|uniref:tyrosine-type recombinase/integrase n=1 Tax=Beijerinckia sp. L45 TaxID=1641855 RepID=UPI00131CC0EE|nr:tyrosine-type recombinase/integrase [Beijerinckia sp. L45]
MSEILPPATISDELPTFHDQAQSDATMVALWIDKSESKHTRRNYQRQADAFLAHLLIKGRSVRSARIVDVQAFMAGLAHLAPATRATTAGAIKSLLSFAQEVGYSPFNVGKAIKAPSVKTVLAERIMSEADAMLLVAAGKASPRNYALITLIYGAGLRISEPCGLRWRDLVARGDAGQVTVYGKGGKTRVVLLSANTWKALQAIRPLKTAEINDLPVFLSRKGKGQGHLDPSQVHRIVKAAAADAGLSVNISTHWLRHAHASHSLDRGAPIHLVQSTMGHASVATTGRYLHARPADSSSMYLAI